MAEQGKNGRCGHHAPRVHREEKPFSEMSLIEVFGRENRKCQVEDLVRICGVCAEEAERALDAHGDDYEGAKDCLMSAALERLVGGEER